VSSLHVGATTPENRYVFSFLGAHVLIWTVLPTLTQPNLPLDVIEGLAWGQEWQWGYYKHPPLWPWLLELVRTLAGRASWAFYLLSQLAVAFAIYSVWRLGRRMFDPTTALLGAVLLEGILFYNYKTPEFNANVAQYPFWGLLALFAHRALREGGTTDWLASGAFAACAILVKYSSLLLLGFILAFAIGVPQSRRRFRTAGPWLAMGMCLLLLAPHLLWLAESGWLPLKYLSTRGTGEGGGVDLLQPLRVLAAATVAALPMLALAAVLAYTAKSAGRRPLLAADRFDRRYLLVIALGPLLCTACIALLPDVRVRTMWVSPMLLWAGLVVVATLPAPVSKPPWRVIAILMTLPAILLLTANSFAPTVKGEPKRIHFPGQQLAEVLERRWQRETQTALRYVLGNEWLAGNIAFHGAHGPSVYLYGNSARNPWVDAAELARHGALVVWDIDTPGCHAAGLAAAFPGLDVKEPLVLAYQTGAVVAPLRVGWGVFQPGAAPPSDGDFNSSQRDLRCLLMR